MPRPCKLTFYLLTLKVVSESRVTCQFVPILVFLGLSVLDLGPMYETDRQTSDRHNRLMPPPYGGGGIIMHHQLAPQPRWQRSGNKPLRHVVRVAHVPADCFENSEPNQRIGCAVVKWSGPQNHFCLCR